MGRWREPTPSILISSQRRTALVQRLDQYRAIATAALTDLHWEEASTRALPATDLTIAGISTETRRSGAGPTERVNVK